MLVAGAFLLPLAAMLTGSLRAAGLPPPTGFEVVPRGATLANYGRVLEVIPFSRYAVNSALVAAAAVPIAVVVASWAGFAVARLPGRDRRFVVGAAMVAVAVPATAVIVGRFWVFRVLGATDGLVPLIAPSLLGVSSILVLVYAWAFRRVPAELFEVARELGASPLASWWRVGMPLVRPVTAVVAALVFALSWGNVLDPLAYVTDERWYTLPLGLRALAGLDPTDQPVMLAASVMAVIPVLAAFTLAQVWLGRRRVA